MQVTKAPVHPTTTPPAEDPFLLPPSLGSRARRTTPSAPPQKQGPRPEQAGRPEKPLRPLPLSLCSTPQGQATHRMLGKGSPCSLRHRMRRRKQLNAAPRARKDRTPLVASLTIPHAAAATHNHRAPTLRGAPKAAPPPDAGIPDLGPPRHPLTRTQIPPRF